MAHLITDIRLEPLVEESCYLQTRRMHYSHNGVVKTWDLALVHDSVAGLLYDQEKQVFILVKQFRPPVWLKNHDGFTYELCAGICDKNVSEAQTMCEEIEEECGYRVMPHQLERITSFYTSVGFAGSRQTLFFAYVDETMRCSEGGGIDNELIEVIELPLQQGHDFMFDEKQAKTPGLLFAFSWFFSRL